MTRRVEERDARTGSGQSKGKRADVLSDTAELLTALGGSGREEEEEEEDEEEEEVHDMSVK